MSARTHTRPHPATTGVVGSRLPWWALALPALAFVVLLVLIQNPAGAHASTGDPSVAGLLTRAQQLMAG